MLRWKKLQLKRYKEKQSNNQWVSANDILSSSSNGSQGIPSHFQDTLDQLQQLYQGLQLHCGIERKGRKWKLK
jgi:hypothetical protein